MHFVQYLIPASVKFIFVVKPIQPVRCGRSEGLASRGFEKEKNGRIFKYSDKPRTPKKDGDN